ncbi:MAG TPA: hypothetical protein VLK33_07725 [Terriglobales bacterium]|nr:hypothetical protein [Terriglobales bacterium]
MGVVLFMMLVIGFSMGTLSGLAVVWLRKAERRGWWIDGLLGMISYVAVFAIVLYFVAMHSRDGFFTNPVLYAFLAALLVPALREWLRTRPRN